MKRESIIQFAFAAIAITLIASAGALSTALTSSSSRNKLVYTDHSLQSLPPQVGLGIAMGPFRGVFINLLWTRAQEMHLQGKHFEAMNLARAITLLQPRFPRVWTFHAWNMAYNVSVTVKDPRERWEWVKKGIELLRDEGLVYNPNDLLIHRELGWIYIHKIGGLTDDSNMYYKQALAAEWTEYLGEPPSIPIFMREDDALRIATALRGLDGYTLEFARDDAIELITQFPESSRVQIDAMLEADTAFDAIPPEMLTEQQANEFARMLDNAVRSDDLPRIKMSQRAAGALFEIWFAKIAQSPDSINELEAIQPGAKSLMDELQGKVANTLDARFLRDYQQMYAFVNSPYATDQIGMNERNQALFDMMTDPERDAAFDALIPFIRKRVLIEELRMEPARMLRMLRDYGPIDFRHPGAHALYWSMRGVEQALNRVEDRNREDFDFLNADRQVLHSLQLLYRYGDVWFDYLNFVMPELAYQVQDQRGTLVRGSLYTGGVSVHLIDSYEQLLTELRIRAIEREDRPEDPTKTAFSLYSAGYENFLRDVVRRLFRAGEVREAERYHVKLITFAGQNANSLTRSVEVGQAIEDWVTDEYVDDRFLTHYVAQADIKAVLQAAYRYGLLAGDGDEFNERVRIARQIHERYKAEQIKVVAANSNMARVEVVNADFELEAGTEFQRFISAISLKDAEIVYDRAPGFLKQWGYEALVTTYGRAQNQGIILGGREFSEVFPEPQGMLEFLARRDTMARNLEQAANLARQRTNGGD